MKKGIVYTVIFSLLASFILVSILSGMNLLTQDIVSRNEETARRRAVLSAFGIPFEDDSEAYRLYDERVEEIEDGEGNVVLYTVNLESGVRYAHRFQGRGLWGTITGILAVNESATVITGIEFISHNETPGLGARIEESAYKEQFDGEEVGEEKLTLTRTGSYDSDHANGRVDAITGATRTSEAVVSIVNGELEVIEELIRRYA